MKSIFNLAYKENLLLDLHLPESDEFGLFVYFHGGGLSKGGKGKVEVFAKTLADRNIATASVEYRMYPDAKFPDYIVDCADSIRWLKDHISQYGKCKKLYVGGSSAGGYLSMMLCFDKRYLNAVGMNPTDIDAYIHDAGQPTSHFRVLQELGKDSKRVIVDETAPMYFVGLEETYSPMLFIVADNDMFGRYEQTMVMVKTLEHFGHKENVHTQLMHSTHCGYVKKLDEDGEGIFAKIILSSLEKMNLA